MALISGIPDYERPGAKEHHFSPYSDNGGYVLMYYLIYLRF